MRAEACSALARRERWYGAAARRVASIASRRTWPVPKRESFELRSSAQHHLLYPVANLFVSISFPFLGGGGVLSGV